MSYLVHFGIKGQKWGVRRYQNEDGSYKSGAEGRYDGDAITAIGRKINDVSAKVQNTSRAIRDTTKRAGIDRAVSEVQKTKDFFKGLKGNSGTKRASSDHQNQTSSGRKKMSSEQKKALAKKIAIGVGATALAAAAYYATSKGMENYANNILEKVKNNSVTSFAEQSQQAHTTSVKRFLRKPKSVVDMDSVRKEVTAYQKHAESGIREWQKKKKGIHGSWDVIRKYGKNGDGRGSLHVQYRAAKDMLKL